MKWTLRFFALLDIICAIFLAEQAYAQFKSFTTGDSYTLIEIFSRTLYILGWLALIMSAILSAIPKKQALVLYYIHLPVRFMFMMFSFGFISTLTYIIQAPFLLNIITPLVIFGEFVRLYITYQIHKKYF